MDKMRERSDKKVVSQIWRMIEMNKKAYILYQPYVSRIRQSWWWWVPILMITKANLMLNNYFWFNAFFPKNLVVKCLNGENNKLIVSLYQNLP